MLAIRSTLKLDVPIAYVFTTNPMSAASKSAPSSTSTPACEHAPISVAEPKIRLIVPISYLCTLIELSNDKFRMNTAQIRRFEERLKELLEANYQGPVRKKMGDQGEWEDKDARKERKRREGLLRQQDIAKAKAEAGSDTEEAEEEIEIPKTAAVMRNQEG